MRKVLISLFATIEKKKLKYKVNLEKVTYFTDPELLKGVWVNLLNNAIKFAPEKGTIFVSCYKRDKQVEVIIGNNGEKINDKEKEKIFEKFYQGDHPKQSLGLGLGLTVVKQLLEILGGEIGVMSTYDGIEGTFFKVRLG
ncbi:sensor histidine kinase [Lactobacillus sp. PV012]|uniref:sensor histidine kinase n=1 Tax=Lactobacillus sp. PV012 TaxID=2594494 RepID=UPI00223F1919|nr:sensor histidine kinase [Lactobacillus sp. PV012]QNQ81612.1 sensor histidine kinase [Lactobacillus sp. PV012]